jgi:biopolymer transport protein ExbB
MIGFLGTVLGMMLTFHEMKIGGQAVKIDQLSGGIMQALVTTVAGLVIGIIAYIAYNMLVAKVETVVHKMENTTLEFMDILQEPAS